MIVQPPTGLKASDIAELCNGTSAYYGAYRNISVAGGGGSVLKSNLFATQLQRQACLKQHYYVFVYPWRWFYSWAVPFFIIFGTVGTTICLVVLTRRRAQTPQREIRNWFIALSVFDIHALLMGLSLMYLRKVNLIIPGFFEDHWDIFQNRTHDPLDLDPKGYNEYTCYAISILNYFGLLTSSWLQAGISVIRALSTLLPLVTRFRLNHKMSNCALFFTVLLSCLAAMTLNFSSVRYYKDPRTQKYECDSGAGQAGQRFFYISLNLKVVLPSICLIISSVLIIHSLREFRRTFRTASRDSLSTNCGRTHPQHCASASRNAAVVAYRLKKNFKTASAAGGGAGGSGSRSEAKIESPATALVLCRKSHQRRISYILLGMNTTFLVFTLPYEIHGVYKTSFLQNANSAANLTWDAQMAMSAQRLAIGQLLNFLIYTNHTTNWLFYFMLGKRFQDGVLALLTLKPLQTCGRALQRITDTFRVTAFHGYRTLCSLTCCVHCRRCLYHTHCRLCKDGHKAERSHRGWYSSSEADPQQPVALLMKQPAQQCNKNILIRGSLCDKYEYRRSTSHCSPAKRNSSELPLTPEHLTRQHQRAPCSDHSNHIKCHSVQVHSTNWSSCQDHKQVTI